MNKITLYAENGKRLDINCKDKSKDGHILLGLLTNNLKVMENESILLSSKDIDMLEKFRINKTKMKVSHHFNTTGKIYSFGYGPKYEKTKQHGYTIGIYADKTKKKKITSSEQDHMVRIEKKIEQRMFTGIEDIARKLSSIPTITSPEIGTLYNVMHLYNENEVENHCLPDFGFLNCHVCFNAETAIEHTECDSSYTMITVPMQPITTSNNGNFNNGVFQFLLEKMRL